MFEGNEKIRIRYYRSLNGEDKYHALNDILHSSKSVVFLGGAGVSTESGIPDFRSHHVYSRRYLVHDRICGTDRSGRPCNCYGLVRFTVHYPRYREDGCGSAYRRTCLKTH